MTYFVWEQDYASQKWAKVSEEQPAAAMAYRERDRMFQESKGRKALRVFPSTVDPNVRVYA